MGKLETEKIIRLLFRNIGNGNTQKRKIKENCYTEKLAILEYHILKFNVSFLLQVCASRLEPNYYLHTVLHRFHVLEQLSFSPMKEKGYLDPEHEMPLLEGALTFIATLLSVRSHLGKGFMYLYNCNQGLRPGHLFDTQTHVQHD